MSNHRHTGPSISHDAVPLIISSGSTSVEPIYAQQSFRDESSNPNMALPEVKSPELQDKPEVQGCADDTDSSRSQSLPPTPPPDENDVAPRTQGQSARGTRMRSRIAVTQA